MSFRKSDLPHGVGKCYVLVVQPKVMLDMNQETLTQVKAGRLFHAALRESLGLYHLAHRGTLVYAYHGPHQWGEGWEAEDFEPCGGELEFTRDFASVMLVKCTKPGCLLDLRARNEAEGLRSILLHLFLKQMVPVLPCGNFLDCGQTEKLYGAADGEGKLEAIRSLGLVALANEVFQGRLKNRFVVSDNEWFALGLIFASGMNTQAGCHGYDEWLQFLVVEKFIELGRLHTEALSSLIGPRPASRS